MTIDSHPITGRIRIRLLRASDAAGLQAAYQVNRRHLAEWEPLRSEEFFTFAGQSAGIASKLAAHAKGTLMPWILLDNERIVGTITLNDIVRGPFLNAHIGYWVDQDFTGQGVGSAAVEFAVETARAEMGLHRVQAATLPHNVASQTVLKRAGFELIGRAPSYLKIAGTWQDHVLYQRILF